MNIELRALSENDGVEIFEMIQEMGPGENGFTNTFPVSNLEEFKLSLSRQVQISQGFARGIMESLNRWRTEFAVTGYENKKLTQRSVSRCLSYK